MKKTLVILSLAFAFVGCSKEVSNDNESTGRASNEVLFNVEVNQADATKAVKTAWEDGDKVYIFFKGLVGTNKYAIFTYDLANTKWTKDANGIVADDLSLPAVTADKAITALFFPFGTPTFTADGTTKFDVTSVYSYYLTATATYTTALLDETLTVNATLNMSIPGDFIQFFVVDPGASDETYTLQTDVMIPTKVSSVSNDGTVAESQLAVGQAVDGYIYGEDAAEGHLFSGKINAAYNTSYGARYYFALKNKSTSARKDLYVEPAGTITSHSAIKLPEMTSERWIPVGPTHYVTLNGVKWGTCNLGADYPEEAGNRYAWGEISPKASYTWANYVWGTAGEKLKKYCRTADGPSYWLDYDAETNPADNKTTLDSADDASIATLGGDWSTPTYSDIAALASGSVVSRPISVGGTKGRIVTVAGNTPMVFFPHNLSTVKGLYWSNVINVGQGGTASDSQQARTLWIEASTFSVNGRDMRYQSAGIRPVHN